MPDRDVQVSDVDTPAGPARLHVLVPNRDTGRSRSASRGQPWIGTLALGHGAGGGIEARDLQATAAAAIAAGWRVALIEQPWRVAGRRVAAAPPRLDEAWIAVLAALAVSGPTGGRPLVVGGRSAGARVACRTAGVTGSAAVCCLAFPLHLPGRPEKSRAPELAAVEVPLVVVQGLRDAFGRPEEVAAVVGADRVRAVPGDHGLSARPQEVARAVVTWLAELP